jgi:diguanylate cyclase (GGDEF)-like protein
MDFLHLQIPLPVALAVVATLGYLFGRQQKRSPSEAVEQQSRRELRRARMVAKELERIGRGIRRNLNKHQARVRLFKERVNKFQLEQRQAGWEDLCREADDMLQPTLRLANQIADAYDQIRQQSANLMTFTELRTDPLTGVCNRRAFDDSLASQFALMERYDSRFSITMIDIDHFKQVNDEHGHLNGDRILQDVAKLVDESARETDIVARYGGEEFVVIMPHTELPGAGVFTERLRELIQGQLPVTISGGVATALDGDTTETLVARADAALYRAKSAGRNCIFRHTGEQIESVVEAASVTVVEAAPVTPA